MKTIYFVLFALLVWCFNSCCSDDYQGNYKTPLLFSRAIKLLDTSNRILKISYKNSDKVFFPNDTVAELIISENKENTLYITTKTNIDTIVLLVEIGYGMSSSRCEPIDTYKYTSNETLIVNQTFDSAFFKAFSTKNTYTDYLFIKP
ncbi:MAG: hypothetical protein ACOYMA_05990 [Bacteroidia bacterium]